MSRLHAKEKPVTVSHMEDDSYHCCRWCHWCENRGIDGWVCINPAYANRATIEPIEKVAEDGKLSDTLQEAMHSVPDAQKKFMQELTKLLYEWGVSEKRVKQFRQVFEESLDQFLDLEMKVEIDTQVSILYNNFMAECENSSTSGVEIKDPFTHYCREFW